MCRKARGAHKRTLCILETRCIHWNSHRMKKKMLHECKVFTLTYSFKRFKKQFVEACQVSGKIAFNQSLTGMKSLRAHGPSGTSWFKKKKVLKNKHIFFCFWEKIYVWSSCRGLPCGMKWIGTAFYINKVTSMSNIKWSWSCDHEVFISIRGAKTQRKNREEEKTGPKRQYIMNIN